MAINNPRPLPADILLDELLIDLDLPVKWTAVGLRMYADDQGRESVNSILLRNAIWSLDLNVTPEIVEDHMLILDRVGYIGLYTANGRSLYAMAQWIVVSHPKPSKFPPPPPSAFQSATGSSLAAFSAGESVGEGGWRESAEGAAGGPAGSPLALPPSPFCRFHQPLGTEADCRHCGTARLAAKQWEQQQRARAQADLTDNPDGVRFT